MNNNKTNVSELVVIANDKAIELLNTYVGERDAELRKMFSEAQVLKRVIGIGTEWLFYWADIQWNQNRYQALYEFQYLFAELLDKIDFKFIRLGSEPNDVEILGSFEHNSFKPVINMELIFKGKDVNII